MSTSNISGPSNPASSNVKSGHKIESKPASGKKSVDDVLATLREMMPGWTISTSTSDWGEGFRNIQIDRDILQRMADDPKEMEKYVNLIKSFEEKVPELEKWAQDNPGQSLVFQFSVNSNGDITSMSIMKTLLGVETRTVFDLPEDKSLWSDLIQQKLNELIQGQVDETTGSKSWIV